MNIETEIVPPDVEERLRQMANSRKHRGTSSASDVHVLLIKHERRGVAIQRVRDLADGTTPWAYTDGPSAQDIYRALDGDTTEEQPAPAGDDERREEAITDVLVNPGAAVAKLDEQGRELERLRGERDSWRGEALACGAELDEVNAELALSRARVAELEPIERRARVWLLPNNGSTQARAVARDILGDST